jgi:solute carrier family 25 carnitine/acylcarnitine transporter 20/29
MACWIPVYPIDVVKTLLQNSEGNDGANAWSIMKTLYKEGGIGAFFDGLTPKVLRAAVNHSATFYIYAVIMRALCPDGT